MVRKTGRYFWFANFRRGQSPSSHGQLLLVAERQELHTNYLSSKTKQELVNSLSQISSPALRYIYVGNRRTSVIDAFFMKINQHFRFVFEVLNIYTSVSKQVVMGLLRLSPSYPTIACALRFRLQ